MADTKETLAERLTSQLRALNVREVDERSRPYSGGVVIEIEMGGGSHSIDMNRREAADLRDKLDAFLAGR